jgi:hypothetical protein
MPTDCAAVALSTAARVLMPNVVRSMTSQSKPKTASPAMMAAIRCFGMVCVPMVMDPLR